MGRRLDHIQVRQAVAGDADSVGGLTERVYSAGGWGDPAYSRLLVDGLSRIEQATVLVATRRDVIVGTVTIARPGTRFAAICTPDELEIRMLAVDECSRRQGVADALLDTCEEFARRERFGGVVLSTQPDMHAAHRLYERRGYTREPDRDRHVGRFHLLAYRLSVVI
jgi:ribosomal protein S18 acetylase RimI-like enzyme